MIEIFLITKQGADATSEFDPASKKVVIKTGSILTINLQAKAPSNIQQNFDMAKQALRDGKLKKSPDGRYEVLEDIPELSPSGASVIVTGKSGSGWKKWKVGDGRLLDVLRSGEEPSSEANPTAKAQPGQPMPTDVTARTPSQRINTPQRLVKPHPTHGDSCENLACQFVRKLKIRNRGRVNLDESRDWLEGAFTASAGGGNAQGDVLQIQAQAKQEIEAVITHFLASLAEGVFCCQSRFEWLFAKAVHQIEDAVTTHSPGSSFSFGRAQKILNIVIKYCYVWWLCKRSRSPKFGDISWVDKWGLYLHVPVDRETMKHLASLQDRNHWRDLVHERGQLVSWKWGMSEYRYLGVQDAIRTVAHNQNLDPICYEMKYIWKA